LLLNPNGRMGCSHPPQRVSDAQSLRSQTSLNYTGRAKSIVFDNIFLCSAFACCLAKDWVEWYKNGRFDPAFIPNQP